MIISFQLYMDAIIFEKLLNRHLNSAFDRVVTSNQLYLCVIFYRNVIPYRFFSSQINFFEVPIKQPSSYFFWVYYTSQVTGFGPIPPFKYMLCLS